jgi:hypothetical protein
MRGMNRIFIGWVDLKEDNWVLAGEDKDYWVSTIRMLNAQILGSCQRSLPGKTVVGAKDKGDENTAGYDLYVKFSDVLIDNGHHLIPSQAGRLYVSIHFIDPTTNAEIGAIPPGPYVGNAWRFVDKLRSALDEVSEKVKVELTRSPKPRTRTAR